MDSLDLFTNLFNDSNCYNRDLVDPLKETLSGYIEKDCYIQDLILLASFIYNTIEPSLSQSDPYSHFDLNKLNYDRQFQEVAGEGHEISSYLFEILVEAHKVFTKPKQSIPKPEPKKENLAKMKIAKSSKEKEKDKKLFKELYMEAVKNDSEFLRSPDIALKILEILNSGLNNDAIQAELLEFLGLQNIEIVAELIQNKQTICETAKSLAPKTGKNHHGANVSIKKESDFLMQKSMKKIQKRQGPEFKSNLDVLRNLGFDESFINENNMLGLKEKKVIEGEYSVNSFSIQKKALPVNLQKNNEKLYTEFVLPAPQKNSISKDHLIPVDAFKE